MILLEIIWTVIISIICFFRVRSICIGSSYALGLEHLPSSPAKRPFCSCISLADSLHQLRSRLSYDPVFIRFHFRIQHSEVSLSNTTFRKVCPSNFAKIPSHQRNEIRGKMRENNCKNCRSKATVGNALPL